MNDRLVEGILDVRVGIGDPEEPGDIRLVVGEQQRRHLAVRIAVDPEMKGAQGGLFTEQMPFAHLMQPRLGPATLVPASPRPGVAEPESRQEVEEGCLGTTIGRRDADQQIIRRGLGVLDENVEVALFVEDAGIAQFEFRLVPAAAPILVDQPGIGELVLGILVEPLQVRGRGRGVEIVVTLLDVLAMVALGVAQAEEAFLEDRIAAIPQGQGEAKAALPVGQAQQAIFAPAVSPAAGVVVGKIIPAVSTGGIVLPHRAPLALGQVGSPAFPVPGTPGILRQALCFGPLLVCSIHRPGSLSRR